MPSLCLTVAVRLRLMCHVVLGEIQGDAKKTGSVCMSKTRRVYSCP